jgi:hypothetical protein
LDGYEEPAETVAEVLGIEIEKILEEVNLLYPGAMWKPRASHTMLL